MLTLAVWQIDQYIDGLNLKVLALLASLAI